jgi:hypothetical protein
VRDEVRGTGLCVGRAGASSGRGVIPVGILGVGGCAPRICSARTNRSSGTTRPLEHRPAIGAPTPVAGRPETRQHGRLPDVGKHDPPKPPVDPSTDGSAPGVPPPPDPGKHEK